MSAYNSKKAPNVSQYIANLNTIPSAHDIATQQQEGFTLDDDLAIFTNTEFLDFDLDQPAPDYDSARTERLRRESAEDKPTEGLGFDGNEYQFPDLPFVPTDPGAPIHSTSLQTAYPAPPFDPSTFNPPTSPYTLPGPQPGSKRLYQSVSPPNGTSVTSPSNLDASSRAAAEEDKRRRNTAASARFRVKKKQREQALEKTAKEMTDRADALEARIGQLELENKWLRNLVVEKTSKGKEDVAELWKRFERENSSQESQGDGNKKGVGTEIKDDGEDA